MEVVVFGIGKFFREKEVFIKENTTIIAFIDNNKMFYGKSLNAIPVFLPNHINKLFYDKILLMSAKANEMKQQLIELGVESEKIWYWEQFFSNIVHGTFRFYLGNKNGIARHKKVLIISTVLNYNGGTLAAFYAAMALQNKGYQVVLSAPDGNKKLIQEITEKGINIVLCLALPYLYQEELFWIQQFDFVLVNVFQMIKCAYEISKLRPSVWWIHEPKELYEDITLRFSEYTKNKKLSGINIYAVSNIAQRNFNMHFPGRIDKVLTYGIPDEKRDANKSKKEKIIFALIGAIIPIKAQDIFLKAIALLNEKDKLKAEFWLIGSVGQSEYVHQIRNMVSKERTVQLKGVLTRSEMNQVYTDIDVVVCPSIEETASIVVTEGLMYGKVCITSNTVGMADYIEDGINGFICKCGNVEDLAEKLQWVIGHIETLEKVCLNARKTYEKYFTLEKFGNRLESLLIEAEKQYLTRKH